MSRQRLHFLTRQPRFILRVCLGILLVGVVTAWIVGKWMPPKHGRWAQVFGLEHAPAPHGVPGTPGVTAKGLGVREIPEGLDEDQLHDWLTKFTRTEFPSVSEMVELPDSLRALPEFQEPMVKMNDQVRRAVAQLALGKSTVAQDRRVLFQHFIDAVWLEGPPRVAAQTALEQMAAQKPVVPLANELLGDMWQVLHDPKASLAAYLLEGERPEAKSARLKALRSCIAQRNVDHLRELLRNPAYAVEITGLNEEEKRSEAILTGNYWELFRLDLNSSIDSAKGHLPETILTLLCGIIWFVMIHQLGGIRVRSSGRGLLALVLGLLSPVVTLTILAVQEHYGTIERTGELANHLLFYVVSVGVREEISKLLLFLPMLPFLRGKSEAEILVVAGCVGLGFAVEENIGYFLHGLSGQPLARLVTANFMHVATTALAGLALARWVRFPRSCWESGVATIVAVILVHGVYDFTIDAPMPHTAMALGSFAGFILLALAHYFLTQLKHLRNARGNIIAPLFAFLVGMSVLAALALIGGTMDSGLRDALERLIGSGLGAVYLIIMFSYHLHRE